MTLSELRERAIAPALVLLPARLSSVPAEAMLLSITLQEDPAQRRRQWPSGPARGLWQFEQAGGVYGVLTHKASGQYAMSVCKARGVEPDPAAVWAVLEHDDVLAAAFARLLLWTDPNPLPGLSDPESGWALYERTWRPGKPHPQRWAAHYAAAVREAMA